jgi:hypothetical protein
VDHRFETWARGEIDRLRAEAREREAEAAQLETVLARFRAVNGLHGRQAEKPAEAPVRRRASKNDVLYDAFAAAGSAGLNMDELEQEAKRVGITPNRNNLRAFCWTAKNAGRLISLAPGRYAIPQKDEAAADTPRSEAAASHFHQQHREADAGGGT